MFLINPVALHQSAVRDLLQFRDLCENVIVSIDHVCAGLVSREGSIVLLIRRIAPLIILQMSQVSLQLPMWAYFLWNSRRGNFCLPCFRPDLTPFAFLSSGCLAMIVTSVSLARMIDLTAE